MPDDQANGGQTEEVQATNGQSGGTGQPGDAAPQVFEVEGVKYTPDQIKELAKAKADYDQFQPEFTRRSQLLSNPDQLIEYAKKQWPDRFPAAPTAPPSADEQALAEAEKILRGRGFTTQDEARKIITEEMEKREADSFVRTEIDRLTKEWDGKDGKPKFDSREILAFASQQGLMPEDAFWKLKRPELLEWHSAQKVKPKAPVVASRGGGTAPVTPQKKVRLDDESYDEAFAEHFGSGN